MIRKVPHGWEVKTLGEVTDIFKGGTPKRNVERYFQGNIPWVTPTDITKLNGALYIDDTETHISEEALGKSAARLLPAGAVLLTSRATIGKVAIARAPIATNQGFANFLCKEEIVNIFLAYYLKLSTDLLISLGTGTTFLEVTKAALLGVEIPVPPLPTQYKIAAVLSAYDDLIENNTRRIEILEEMAAAIYREWFVEFRFPDHEGGEMVESELGLIPQGWEVKQLGAIVSEIIDYRGKTPKKLGGDWAESGIMALSAMNVKQGKLVNLEKAKFVSEQLYEKWMKSEITKNDILMTSEAPLGEVYYLTEKKKICLSQRLYCIRANPNIIKPSFLFYAISSPSIQSQLHANATGTTVLGIRQTALRKISVIIPPVQLQSKAESVLETLITSKETLEKKNTNLRRTRDLLLPKLISGEIDVSKLDIDTDRIQPKKGGTHIPKSLKDWLHSDENILGGNPVIKGTRLTIAFLLELLECGWSEKKVLENYPNIKREHIDACLAFQQEVTRASVSR